MHAIVATPSSGLHAYFTGGDQVSGRLPRHHLDFKSRGGYVLAPPSQVNGKAACRVIEAGQPGALDDLAAAAAATGLTDREIARTIASARRGHQRPLEPAPLEHQLDREGSP